MKPTPIRPVHQRLRIARAFALAAMLSGCNALPVKTEIVALPPYPAPQPHADAPLAGTRLFVAPLRNAHTGFDAGLITSLGAPTYRLNFEPPMTEALRGALERELAAAGATIAGEDTADVLVEGSVDDYTVSSDSTPLYWDVHADLAVTLVARGRGGGALLAATPFRVRHTERTYLYPSHEVVGTAVARCFVDFSNRLRAPRGIVACVREVRR